MTRSRQVNIEFPLDASRTKSKERDTIAEADCFANIMRDENNGATGFRPDALELVVQEIAGLLIQRRERLVHQEHVLLGGQSASQRNPLPHSARNRWMEPMRNWKRIQQRR